MDGGAIAHMCVIVGSAAAMLSFVWHTKKSRKGISGQEIQGNTLRGNSAIIAEVKYSLTLKFIVNNEELMIRAIYQPPYYGRFLLSKLKGVRKREGLFTHVYLSYSENPDLVICISEALAKEIQQDSGGNWQFEG